MSTAKNRFGILRRGGLSALAALFSLSALPAAAQNAWVIADFNGDQKPDLVTLASAPGSIPGIRDALFDDGALTLISHFQHQTLRVRDLDGDSDRDLIVESGSGIAVWLNDGTGHFTLGRAEDFHLQPHTEDSRSCDPTPKILVPDISDESPHAGLIAPPRISGVALIRSLELCAAPGNPPIAVPAGRHTRGPPSLNS